MPLLLELPLFSGLTREELLDLLSDARVAVAPAASPPFLQGDTARISDVADLHRLSRQEEHSRSGMA